MDTEQISNEPIKAGKSAKDKPANRLYVFAKNCTNDHGSFSKGDKARGAFSDELVQSYLAAGVLVPKEAA